VHKHKKVGSVPDLSAACACIFDDSPLLPKRSVESLTIMNKRNMVILLEYP
jgi:hypothetical protein